MLSNIQEIKARKGVVVVVATEGDAEAHELADYIIEIPDCEEELSPDDWAVVRPLFSLITPQMDWAATWTSRAGRRKSVTVE